MTKILDRYLKEDMTVVDAGCGSGFFSKYFQEKKCRTFALDYSDAALAMTRRTAGDKIVALKADFLKDDLNGILGLKADLIFSDGLFEHFDHDDQVKIMKNFASLVVNGGLVVTFVPNKYSPWQLIRPFYMPGIKEEPFVMSALKALNLNAGLKNIENKGVNVMPFQFSPESLLGNRMGMLLYSIAVKP